MRLVGVAELPVDLVGNQEQVVPAAEFSDGYHLAAAEEFARGVAGIAEQHGAGPPVHELLEFRYVRNSETVMYVGGYGPEGYAVQVREGLVVRVVGFDHDYLVSLVGDYLHRVGEGLASRYLDQQLADLDVYAYFPVVFLHQPFAELHQSGRIGVGEVMQFPARVRHGIECAVRRLYVRSADIQVIDFHAFRLRRVGERNKLSDCRCRHQTGFFGNSKGHGEKLYITQIYPIRNINQNPGPPSVSPAESRARRLRARVLRTSVSDWCPLRPEALPSQDGRKAVPSRPASLRRSSRSSSVTR